MVTFGNVEEQPWIPGVQWDLRLLYNAQGFGEAMGQCTPLEVNAPHYRDEIFKKVWLGKDVARDSWHNTKWKAETMAEKAGGERFVQTHAGACQGEKREEERDTARKPGHTEGTSREEG